MTTLDLGKGWKLFYDSPEDWKIFHPDDQGRSKYFDIQLGQYSPMMIEEPVLAVNIAGGNYVDAFGAVAVPVMPLIGIICKDAPGRQGKVLYRGNLTNFFGRDGGQFVSSPESISVTKDGQTSEYRLFALHACNKTRIVGYIGFYLPVSVHDGSPVEILEAENVI